GQDVKTVHFLVARTFSLNDGIVQYPTGRLGHKGDLIPIRFGEIPCGVKIMACRRCITSVPIHLTEERSNVWHVIVGIYSVDSIAGTSNDGSFQVSVRHSKISAVLPVGRGRSEERRVGKEGGSGWT